MGHYQVIEQLDPASESVNPANTSIWPRDAETTDKQMAKPKMLFVANGVLGWATYARQLGSALALRDDIDATILHRKPGRMHQGRLGRDIRQAVAAARPDVVHFAAHWPAGALTRLNMPFTIALDATRAGIGRDLPLPGWTRAEMATEAELCRSAAHLFPMSEWAADSLRADYGVDTAKITVQPPSLSPDAWPAPATPANAVPQILFIGNDLTRKGAKRLAGWVEGPLAGRCHLHIVSTDRATPPAGPNITFHGRIPHDRLMAEVLPKAFVLAEAMAAGVPVVASRIGGIPDLVAEEETGLLVSPDDDDGFVRALERLCSDSGLRYRMSLTGRKRAREFFDGKSNFDVLIDRLITLAETAKGARI